jgi:hypothetical protein
LIRKTAVDANFDVFILARIAMHAQPAQPFGEGQIVGGHQPAVAGTPQVLGGEETETADASQNTRPASLVLGPNGLTGVFDNRQPRPGGDAAEWFHLGTLAEKVDRHDRPGAGTDFLFDRPGIDVEADRVDVDEDGAGTDPGDAAAGGEEGERTGDDFITPSNIERHQGQQQGVGSGGAGDGLAGVAVAADIVFELGHFIAQNESLLGEDFLDGVEHRRSDLPMLGDKVNQGNWTFRGGRCIL